MERPFVLIVEDTPDLAELFADTLALENVATEIVNTGQAALDRLEEITPDMILLDLHMPGMSGDKVLEKIRENKRLDDTKVVIATADGHGGMALVDEADMVLLKPISPAQLSILTSRLLKSSSKDEE